MTGDEKKAEAAAKTELPEQSEKLLAAPPTEYKFAMRPEAKPGLEGFLNFMWNSETKEFMGRTGMSWLKITIFYIIYYSFLALFFIICLSVFLLFLNDTDPMWQNTESIIGNNPGMGYRPHPHDKQIESTLIWYRHGRDSGNWNGTSSDTVRSDSWMGRLEKDLQPYHNKTYQSNEGRTDERMFMECGEMTTTAPGPKQMCKVNSSELFVGKCTPDNHYGFADGKPCIMIKLNKIFGWVPSPYTEESQLPENIPEAIREEFRKNINDGAKDLNNKVWLECHGENPGDRENLGPINYHPGTGFSANFYPYLNQEGFLSPIVFAQLENPKMGVMISIECKAWDQHIKHDSTDKMGLVHFELMID